MCSAAPLIAHVRRNVQPARRRAAGSDRICTHWPALHTPECCLRWRADTAPTKPSRQNCDKLPGWGRPMHHHKQRCLLGAHHCAIRPQRRTHETCHANAITVLSRGGTRGGVTRRLPSPGRPQTPYQSWRTARPDAPPPPVPPAQAGTGIRRRRARPPAAAPGCARPRTRRPPPASRARGRLTPARPRTL